MHIICKHVPQPTGWGWGSRAKVWGNYFKIGTATHIFYYRGVALGKALASSGGMVTNGW